MKKLLYCLFLLLAFVNCSAQMGKHIETDRPNETDVPYIAPRKYFQVEAGVRIEKTQQDERISSYPTVLLKYGLSDNLELRARTSYSTLNRLYIPASKKYSGLEPVEFGIKAAILKEKKWIPKTALLFQTGIPPFSSGVFKTSHLAPDLRLLMENNITDAFSINYNIGAQWDGEETSPEWIYSLTPGIDIGEHVHVFGEFYSFLQKKESPAYTLDGGIEYFVGKNIGLDICSGIGLNKAASPYFFTMGGSVRF